MNFPKTLLCGEVQLVTLTFTNTGSTPLHKLKVASSNPKYCVLGTYSDNTMPTSVYKSLSGCASRQNICEDSAVKRVTDINIPGGSLQPNTSFSLPLWVRGNDIGGIHEVDFLFYYEAVQQLKKHR